MMIFSGIISATFLLESESIDVESFDFFSVLLAEPPQLVRMNEANNITPKIVMFFFILLYVVVTFVDYVPFI